MKAPRPALKVLLPMLLAACTRTVDVVAERTSPPRDAGVEGILGCVTAPRPSYGVASSSALSRTFQRACAPCHGGRGEGLADGPALPGALSADAYVARTQQVHRLEGLGSEAELRADHAALSAGGLALDAPTEEPFTGSAPRRAEALQQGLAQWRAPGAVTGQACTGCHSSDGVELALLAVPDGPLLQRALQHVALPQALALRDFIHAQRAQWNLAALCERRWRPFQPSGTVLAGAGADAQDDALFALLGTRGLLVVDATVRTLAQAREALQQLQAVELRDLPLGIALPLLSDPTSINDWFPVVPFAPNDAAVWFAREDAYLQNPTDAALEGLLAAQADSNDVGYSSANRRPTTGACLAAAQFTTDWLLGRVNRPRRRALLVAAHLFREELRERGSWLRRGRPPFPASASAINPMLYLGGQAALPPCDVPGGAAEWIAGFPPEVRAQFPVSDVDAGTVKAATDALSHPWMTLGQVIDPTLMGSEPDEGNKLNYWAFRTFTQRTVHLPLLFSLKLARQIDVWERLRGQPAFPVTLGPYGGSTDVHPLFAKALQSHAGLTVAVPPGRAQSARLNRFKSNLLRMQLLLREEQLRAGAAIPTNQGNDHCESVTCEVSALRGFPQEIIALSQQPGVQAAWEAEGFDVALAGQGTLMLLDSVSALLSTAPRR